jgi:hypothetical protein
MSGSGPASANVKAATCQVFTAPVSIGLLITRANPVRFSLFWLADTGIRIALPNDGLKTVEDVLGEGWLFMDNLQQEARTVAVKACAVCRSGLLERDRFCRLCGARQPDRMGSALDQATDGRLSVAGLDRASLYTTVDLDISAPLVVYRRVSAPLVNAVVTGALAGASSDNQSRVLKRMILALISIPVWLMIVLLSPLDAYAAVKNLAR